MIKNVSVDQNVEKYIKTIDKGEAEGRGGMGSKLNIAKQTASKNIPTFIANGKRKRVILDIVEGKSVGTMITV